MDYEKLTTDLIKAKNKAKEAAKGEDGGTANSDSVFIILPRAREVKVLDAICSAGLHCTGKTYWIGNGYLISPPGGGQGNSRARAMEAMTESLKEDGYDVLGYYQMD